MSKPPLKNEKILILEAEWCTEERKPPFKTRSAAKLYAAFGNTPASDRCAPRCASKPLRAATYRHEIQQFLALPTNQRGVNIIILSSHGHYQPFSRWLGTLDGHIELSLELPSLATLLKRSLLILDSCHIGQTLEELHTASKALGIVGFSGKVDWLASSIFIIALLRRLQQAGVFQLQRRSVTRVRNTLLAMQQDSYQQLMNDLGVVFAF